MTPEKVYLEIERRRPLIAALQRESTTLELADRLRVYLAQLDTGDLDGARHSLAELRMCVAPETVGRAGIEPGPDPNWQVKVWQSIEAAPPPRRSWWRRLLMLGLFLLPACDDCRETVDRRSACDVERRGHAQWEAHPEWHCRGDEPDYYDCYESNCRVVPLGCSPEPTLEDCP